MDAVDLGIANAPLIERARRGEPDARESLAREAVRPAFLFALQLLGDGEDARDVAQEAVMRLLRTLDRFDAARPMRPWLFRIVRNVAIDLQRSRRVRPTQSLTEIAEKRPDRLVDGSPGPFDHAERRELQERIWAALDTLPSEHREILVLRDYQDLSYAEIAMTLEIPLGTVMSRLHRARRQLRDHLAIDPRKKEA